MPFRIRVPGAVIHHSTAIGGTVLITGVTAAALLDDLPVTLPLPLALALSPAAFALSGGGILTAGAIAHADHLCAWCAATMPLNAPEAAERRRWALRLTHRIHDRPRSHRIAAGVALVAALLLLPTWALPPIAIACVGVYALSDLHRRYSAWCPWCHPGGGGDDYPAPHTPTDPGGAALTH